MKQSIFRSPILSLSEKPLFEDFSSSIQKNTTNESYSLTDKGTLAFTTSNKKIKTSFEDMNSNGKLEAIIGNVIEFEEFNPIIRDNNNLTGQFGKNLEEIRKINENSERMSEVLNRENEDFKKKIVNQAKEIDFLKENMMMLDKNSYSSSNIAKIERRNEELLKEIVMLKQNLIEMNQNCKDSDIENIKLKEEIEYRVCYFIKIFYNK